MTEDEDSRLRQRLRRILRPAFFGTLRRTSPLSERWGEDRGRPVDRYYIERFLAAHRADIRGHVLEVKDPLYTHRYGIDVQRSDVLDAAPDNPYATIVADLQAADGIRSDSLDCFILTQTLQFVYDFSAAVRHTHRILRPGGVVLATMPAVSRTTTPDDRLPDYWRFTPTSCLRLFGDVFGEANVQVWSYGNVLSCVAFLVGLADQELKRAELDVVDERFPLILAVRATK